MLLSMLLLFNGCDVFMPLIAEAAVLQYVIVDKEP